MAFICISFVRLSVEQVECKKAQPKEVMFPPGTRGRARGLPYTMDAFMLGMGMLGESGRGSLGTPQSHHVLGAPEAWAPNWVTYQLGKLPFWVSDDKPLCEVLVTITEIGRLIDNHLVPCLAHGGT